MLNIIKKELAKKERLELYKICFWTGLTLKDKTVKWERGSKLHKDTLLTTIYAELRQEAKQGKDDLLNILINNYIPCPEGI